MPLSVCMYVCIMLCLCLSIHDTAIYSMYPPPPLFAPKTMSSLSVHTLTVLPTNQRQKIIPNGVWESSPKEINGHTYNVLAVGLNGILWQTPNDKYVTTSIDYIHSYSSWHVMLTKHAIWNWGLEVVNNLLIVNCSCIHMDFFNAGRIRWNFAQMSHFQTMSDKLAALLHLLLSDNVDME